jgi:peptide/nickel transport system permease protein
VVSVSRSSATLDADERGVEELVGVESESSDRLTDTRERSRRVFDAYVLAPVRIAWNDLRTRVGFLILSVYLVMLIASPYFDQVFRNQAPPSVPPFNPEYTRFVFGIGEFSVGSWTYTGVWRYPLGTSAFGEPLLPALVNATPEIAKLVLAGSVVSIGLAVLIGTLAGYKGGFLDDVLMSFTDIVLTIPGLPLTILLVAIFPISDPFLLGMILAINNWPGLARALRSQVLTIRQESYTEASRAMGASSSNILRRDIVPQLMPYILISAARGGRGVVNEAVGLYFLGIIPRSGANWGVMMDVARQNGAVANLELFYWILWPMLALAGLTFGLVLFAQGLDKVFNPRLRARHAETLGGDDEEDLPTE